MSRLILTGTVAALVLTGSSLALAQQTAPYYTHVCSNLATRDLGYSSIGVTKVTRVGESGGSARHF